MEVIVMKNVMKKNSKKEAYTRFLENREAVVKAWPPEKKRSEALIYDLNIIRQSRVRTSNGRGR